MSNVRDFQSVWSDYRRDVSRAVEARDKELKRLERYEGKRADTEREAARVKFNQAVEAARNEARGRFGRVLEDMRDKADVIGEVMQAPTQEQLNVLQMLSLRSSISQSEAESAARALAGNDDCLSTLQQLCATRGGAKVAGVNKSKQNQAFAAVSEFARAASGLLGWQGGDRYSLMLERNAQRSQGVANSELIPMLSAVVADIDGSGTVREFVSQIVGDAATFENVMQVD